MTEYQEKAIVAIKAQQAKLEEDSMPWLVRERLKDICRMECRSDEILTREEAEAALKKRGRRGQPNEI